MMYQAGFVTFFRTILIFLLIIYGMRFITRFIIPIVLKRAVNKAQERARQRTSNYDDTSSDVKVGETVIDKKPRKPVSSNTDGVGDYVDYEEIE